MRSVCPRILLGCGGGFLCQWLYCKHQEDSDCGLHRAVAVSEGCYLVHAEFCMGAFSLLLRVQAKS